MTIRCIIFAIIYLVLGVLTLEMVLVHDRKTSFMEEWIGMDDHGIQIMIVLFFPGCPAFYITYGCNTQNIMESYYKAHKDTG